MAEFTVSDIHRAVEAMREAEAALKDGDEVQPGVTYRVIDGEVFYQFSPETVEHIRKIMGWSYRNG